MPVVGDIPDAGNVGFALSIHADVPEPPTHDGFSMPGETLWTKTFAPGEFAVRPYISDIQEGWYDPATGLYISSNVPADTICWQYNFLIDSSEAFAQQGSPSNPIVYWLEVQAVPLDQQAQFGWKTSLQHWNDDAVWTTTDDGLQWQELRYPDGHFYQDQSIDLAFVITPEPATVMILGIGGLVFIRKKRDR